MASIGYFHSMYGAWWGDDTVDNISVKMYNRFNRCVKYDIMVEYEYIDLKISNFLKAFE